MLGTKIRETRHSKINGKIDVVKTLGLGTYIQVQGLTQSGGLIVDVWRDTLKKINQHRLEIGNCLILGLGGGSAAKLVRRYWPLSEITGVEIDPLMVELGEKYLGLDEKDVDIIISDATKYLSDQKLYTGDYDLILIDMYLGDKVPPEFEKNSFIKKIEKLLTLGGIAVFNRLYYGEKRPEAVKFAKKLEGVFSQVDYFYPEANLMLICSK